MRELVEEGARSIDCDPSMIALPALAAAAGAIGATRTIQLKRDWLEPAVLWCVVVSPSGAMKSQGRKLVLAPILDQQRRLETLYHESQAAYESRLALHNRELVRWKQTDSKEPPPVAPRRPVLKELFINDATVEAVAKALHANPRGLLLERDELAAWIGSYDQYKSGQSDAQSWINMHGAGFIKVNRAGKSEPLFVHRACVSVSGTIQPAILSATLTKRHRDTGLAARLLIASPPRRPKRWTDEEVSESVLAAFAERIAELLDLDFVKDEDGEQQAVPLRLSAPAQARWREFVNRHGKAGLGLEGDQLAAWSKLEGYAARLALVMTLFEDPAACEVDEATLVRAIKLIEWFGNEAARFYSTSGESSREQELHGLMTWIRSKYDGVITPRELAQQRRKYNTTEKAEIVLQKLVDAGYGDWRVVQSTKPRREFVVKNDQATTNPS